jgi:hypothetical protein
MAAMYNVVRSRFQLRYGISLTDAEITEYNQKLKAKQSKMAPCGCIFGIIFIIIFVNVGLGNLNIGSDPALIIFIVFAFICPFAGAISSIQRNLDRTFSEEIKGRRASSPGYETPAAPGTFSGSSMPSYRVQPAPVPYQPPVPNQVILKETVVVKIRCQWCGGLVDQGVAECPSCGGKM